MWSLKILWSKFGGFWDSAKVKYFETTQKSSVFNVLNGTKNTFTKTKSKTKAEKFTWENL